ncbi:MAG: hypothetical protein HOP23_12335 [Methylococcaceae bacterium]|nr:hypothetical protein [Methylococcaceae bacterium]
MSSSPPPYAKLNPPHTANIIPRERLFARLDQLKQNQAVWVGGPPGAGKTALVASYLTVRSMRSLWYQVDSGDTDVSTFFYYLRETVIAQFPRTKNALQLLTPEYLGDIQGYSRRFFRQLFARYPENSVLVLDNFQEASGSQAFCDAVQVALSEAPPQFCVIVISRFVPPDSFARLCANRSIALLAWDELKFTATEMHAIATESGIDQSVLATLVDLAQGWVAGLVLLLEYIRQKGSTCLPQARNIARQALFDYFTGEIFAAFSEQDRDALLRLGMFSSFTELSARCMTGTQNIELLLERLFQHRLFIGRISEPFRYEFHPLFREFLCIQAGKIWPEHELATIRIQAAHLSEQEGAIDDALGLYAEASDWPELMRLINRQAAAMLAHGRYKTLSAWIGRFPEDIVVQQPWMLYWQAAAEQPFNPALSRAGLEKANTLFKSDNDITGRFLTCSLALRSFYMEWSDAHGVDAWLPEMEVLYARHGASLPPEIEAQVLAAGIGIFYRHPGHPLLPIWARRALQLLTSPGFKPNEQMPASDFVVVYYLHKGDMEASAQALDAIRTCMELNETPPVITISLAAYSTIYAVQSADHDAACRHVDNGLTIARAQGINVFDAILYGLLVHAHLSAGNGEQAEAALLHMEKLRLHWRRIDNSFVHYLRSGLCLLRGEAAGALDAVKASMAITEATGTPLQHNFGRIGLIHALIGLGDFDAAKRELAILHEFADEMPSYIFGFNALLAECHLALKSTASGAELLAAIGKAFAHGRQHGYMNAHPFWLPEFMSELCGIALQHDIETDYVIRLVHKRGMVPPAELIEAWPWPVKMYTLGRFSLVLEDLPFRHTGKMQKKTLDLLKAIIALGGRNVTSARLADLFWPEAEATSARSAFDMALHRLRKLLGRDDAILLSEGKVTLNPACCWVDVWHMERLMNEIEDLLKHSSVNEDRLAHLTGKVLHLYQGAFLGSDCDQPWIFAMSEKIRQKFLRQIKSVGMHWQGTGQYTIASALFERYLEQDPLAEEFYRLLMLCHDAAGNRSEAVNTYHRCRKILARMQGSKPSEATEILYRQLSL